MQNPERVFTQILQELRVVQTGVQILSAFLLTLPFTARFAGLGGFEKAVYTVSVVAAVLSVVLVIAPVACRSATGDATPGLVRLAAHLAQAGMAALAVAVVASLLLTLEVGVGKVTAAVCTGVIATAFLVFWVALPWRHHKHAGRQQSADYGD
jgi:hypothetical protein